MCISLFPPYYKDISVCSIESGTLTFKMETRLKNSLSKRLKVVEEEVLSYLCSSAEDCTPFDLAELISTMLEMDPEEALLVAKEVQLKKGLSNATSVKSPDRKGVERITKPIYLGDRGEQEAKSPPPPPNVIPQPQSLPVAGGEGATITSKKDKKGKKKAVVNTSQDLTTPSGKTTAGINDMVDVYTDTQADHISILGRGVQRKDLSNAFIKDIIIEKFSLSYEGLDILIDSKLIITHGHIYGLIGANGSGKSTLLKRMAAKSITGFPTSMSVKYLAQDLDIPSDDKDCIDIVLFSSDIVAQVGEISTTIREFEREMDSATDGDVIEEYSTVLDSLYEKRDSYRCLKVNEDGSVEVDVVLLRERAREVLSDFHFKEEQIIMPAHLLSGGLVYTCILCM